MKYFFCILFIALVYKANAATWIVSNVPGFPANFSSLQACVDAAANGDIIIVQGSGASYGDVEVTKMLTILGPGYFLNQNPQTQAVMASAKLNSIYFKNGSGGSILEGMNINGSAPFGYPAGAPCFSGSSSSYSIKIDSAAVTCIANYWEDWIQVSNSTGTVIKGCFGNSIFGYINISDLHVENTIFINAFFNNAVVKNSLFYYGINAGSHCVDNCIFINNIISNSPGYFSFGNSSFSNNIFTSDPLGVNAGNNLVNVDPNTLFIGFPNQGGNSYDGRFRLKSGSPAIGNGEGGTDIGPFGGNSPYQLSGISLHPNIWFVNMPSVGTSGGGLQVQIKVNAND
ncbi:MAG: hypothetical protein U0V75_04220 [Ferruginibacter sp.]